LVTYMIFITNLNLIVLLLICSNNAEQNDYAYSTSQLTRLLSKNPQWSRIRDTERERLGLTLDHEREFWYIT
jgi:mannitol/fructose-specific phosphotransferase system IIA component (Ntr-type)